MSRKTKSVLAHYSLCTIQHDNNSFCSVSTGLDSSDAKFYRRYLIMLVLTRKAAETIRIGNDIVIKVIKTAKGTVKIGIGSSHQHSRHARRAGGRRRRSTSSNDSRNLWSNHASRVGSVSTCGLNSSGRPSQAVLIKVKAKMTA